ncbi:MAG: MFS transporter [Actinobacteria bacterium]|nr:MFS transporter [Actinomycetota bacterium]
MRHPFAQARVATSVAYAGQGLCFAALVTRIPTIQDRFSLTDTSLALLLGLVPVVAGVGSLVAGSALARVGSAPVLRVLGPLTPLALVGAGFSSSLPLLVGSLTVIGFALGAVDAAMNAQAVSIEVKYGRSLMGSFFAVFSFAGILGATLAAVAAGSSIPLGVFFAIIAVAVIPGQLVVGPWLLRGRVELTGQMDDVSPGHPSAAKPQVPWAPIVVIGIALTCVYVADSAASNWSAVYLTEGLGSSESLAALAYGVYALTTLLARAFVDRGVMSRGPVLLVRLGASVAVVASLLIALAPSPAWGLVAFGLLGLGAAPIIPLAFTAAAQHDELGTGLAIARVNVFNYVGFVLGAPLIGIVADLSSLRWAFALLAPILLVVVALAPAFRVTTRRSVGSASLEG